MPFEGEQGRLYRYGEFSPTEISPFAYNESAAVDFFPLTKEEIMAKGYKYREAEEKKYTVTIKAEDIPDRIQEVGEGILQEVLGCRHAQSCSHQCFSVFRLTQDELNYYKQNTIPLPDLCPNCRHYERFAHVPPPKLWKRSCMCTEENHTHKTHCQNEFETPYAPERPERVYCENCYQKSVL
jgi:hypothetical protein